MYVIAMLQITAASHNITVLYVAANFIIFLNIVLSSGLYISSSPGYKQPYTTLVSEDTTLVSEVFLLPDPGS